MAGEREAAIITGGTRGIGAAIARQLAGRGVDLLLSGRHRDDEVEALLAELGDRARFEAADAADPASAERLVAAAMEAFGRIDYLVPAAGGAVPGTALTLTPEAWEDAFRVHVHGAVPSLPRGSCGSGGARRRGAARLLGRRSPRLSGHGRLSDGEGRAAADGPGARPRPWP